MVLFKAGYEIGAIYLAGYSVECILKSLILANATVQRRSEIMDSFRGSRAHDFEWLRTLYRINGGEQFSREVASHFMQVNSWSTDLRYTAGSGWKGGAEAFLNSAQANIQWDDRRLS